MNFEDMWSNAMKSSQRRNEEYDRLRADPPKSLNIGDKVLFAAGLLGMGYEWIRIEAEVTDCRATSVKLKFKNNEWDEKYKEIWVDSVLVTDIIEKTVEEKS